MAQSESDEHAADVGAARDEVFSAHADVEGELADPVLGELGHEGDLVDEERVFGALQLEDEDRVLGDGPVREVRGDGQVLAVGRESHREVLPFCGEPGLLLSIT